MPLREEMEQTGNWLFRWRSYLPLILLVVVIGAMRTFHYPLSSHRLDDLWDSVCVFVSLFGVFIRVITVGHAPRGTSGRNVKNQVADVLNTTGMYSIVRHPLYLGNFFMWLGVAMFPEIWWLTIILVMAFFLYYERIMLTEEAYLRSRYGAAFEEWAKRTPLFLPRFRQWRKSALPFSLITVLRREYSAIFGVTTIFTLLEVIGEYFVSGQFRLGLPWILFFIVGAVQFVVLRTMKKMHLLDVQGR